MACMQKSKYRRDKTTYEEMYNLARDAAEAKAAGMSYGQWKAMQDKPVVIKEKTEVAKDTLAAGWKVCLYCGKPFRPSKWSTNRQQYCEIGCQKAAQKERDREKMRVYHREYMAKKRAEMKGA